MLRSFQQSLKLLTAALVLAVFSGAGLTVQAQTESELIKILEAQIAAQKKLVEAMKNEKPKEVFDPLKEFSPLDAITLDKPVFASMRTLDRKSVRGDIVGMAGDEFLINVNRKVDQQETRSWNEFGARDAFNAFQRVIGNSANAEQWAYIGAMLLAKNDDEDAFEYAEKAFEKALKAEMPEEETEAFKTKLNKAVEMAEVRRIESENPVWGVLTKTEEEEAIEKLKGLGKEAQEKVSDKIKLYETEYFLFYSDLPEKDAKNWQGLLDRMYKHLSKIFNINRGVNIWHGKCVVFAFSDERNYIKFESEVMGLNPAWVKGSLGLCHSYPDGRVVVSLFMLEKELEFAHVLVHETGHGFVHRYKSSQPVPSWANEGLVEVVAEELTKSGMVPARLADSYSWMQWLNNSMGGNFFDASHIDGWQYGIAADFTSFLMKANKKKYVEFFNLMKEGMESRDALEKAYGVDYRKLVQAYGKTVGIQNLKP